MKAAWACEAGSPERSNEDWCGSAGGVAVVLDGATSSNAAAVHDTPRYVHQLGLALLAAASDTSALLEDALAEAIDHVWHGHGKRDGGSPAATVAVVRVTADRVDYLVLADTTIVLDVVGSESPLIVTDTRVDEVTAMVGEHEAHQHRIGSAEHRAAVESMSAAQQAWRNREGGYWVAADDPAAAAHAITGSRARVDVRRVALMSDGAARLADVFGEPWPNVLTLLDERGPDGLIRHVREIERSDQDGRRWPRFKTSDDAACLELRDLRHAERAT
jgi:hypothetical protein